MNNLANLWNIGRSIWGISISIPSTRIQAGDLILAWLLYWVWCAKGSFLLAVLWGAVDGMWRFIFG